LGWNGNGGSEWPVLARMRFPPGPHDKVTSLEGELEASLHHAWSNGTDPGDLAKVPVAWIGVRLAEAGVVERVEGLPAELQLVTFLNRPVLDDGQIRSADWSFLNHELLGISRSAVSIVRKRSGIEIGVKPVTLASLPDAERLTHNPVRAILSNQKTGSIVALAAVDGEGSS
jgi:hypothetical protein